MVFIYVSYNGQICFRCKETKSEIWHGGMCRCVCRVKVKLWCLAPLSTLYFSYIVTVRCLGGGNCCTRRKPPTSRKSLTNFITHCCMKYTSPWVGFELKNVVVIPTDCINSCQSNYNTMTTTAAPAVGVGKRHNNRFACWGSGQH